jgi:hypothetical protein
MASPKGIDEALEASDLTFPAADVDEELRPGGENKNFEVDTISSEVATSSETKVRLVLCFDLILKNN